MYLEYMKMHASLIPDNFANEYQLKYKVMNGCMHVKIIRGMHGLPQAGRLANNLLK